MDPITEEMLVNAMRQRLLDEIQRGASPAEADRIVNNIYGMATPGPGSASVYDMMQQTPQSGQGMTPQDLEYFVDITRENLPINPETGKPSGWTKKVHRYTQKKKEKSPVSDDPQGGAAELTYEPLSEGGTFERQNVPRETWMQGAVGQIDPAKYAGEGIFATEEYARPQDIGSPYTRAEVGREGEPFPTPAQYMMEPPAAPMDSGPDYQDEELRKFMAQGKGAGTWNF